MDRYREALAVAKAGRPQAAELHGVDLMKSASGQNCVETFLKTIFAAGCLPVWSVSDKHYCVAGKIVETFFDPHNTPDAFWLPTGANQTRQMIANYFHGLPMAFLRPFLDAYREPSRDALLESARSLRNATKLKGDFLLSDTLDSAIENIDAIVAGEMDSGIFSKRYISASLNLPTFVQFMSDTDRLLAELGADEVEVVHDETSEFEGAFRWAFDTYSKAKDRTSFVLQSGDEVHFGIAALKNFRTGSSEKEPEIQGADLLASAIRVIFIAFLRDKPLSGPLESVARLIFGCRPESVVGNFWVAGSTALWARFAQFYHRCEPAKSVA